MTGTRIDEIRKVEDFKGMVLTDEERENVSYEDIIDIFQRLEGHSIGAGYVAERLFGQVKWGDEAFYE